METVYDKIKVLNELLEGELGFFVERDLFKILGKLATWHYRDKRTVKIRISKRELEVYEFLVLNKYNPSTVYKWFLASRTNSSVQEKLASGGISIKDALGKAKPFKGLSQVDVEFLGQVKLAFKKYLVR